MIDVISEAHNKRHSSGQKHPPKPRLTVRVGITGHRSDKLDMTSTDSVRRHLPTLFASIEKAALRFLPKIKTFISTNCLALGW